MNFPFPDPESGWRDLLFGVRRSFRYHERRVMFFSRQNRVIRFISLLSGMSVVAAVLKDMGGVWVIGSGVAVALISAWDLVVNTEGKMRLHVELSGRFLDLERRMVLAPAAGRAGLLAEFTAERLRIEAGEPPTLRVLDCICHNDLMRAMGYESGDYARIAWYQRLFAQWFDLRGHALKTG